MTESPLRNILGMNLLLVTGTPFLPFLGISVHTSCTFSMTMFMWRSKAFTFPSSFLLFRSAIRTSLLALTDLVSRENGPVLKFYYCGLRSVYISTLIIIDRHFIDKKTEALRRGVFFRASRCRRSAAYRSGTSLTSYDSWEAPKGLTLGWRSLTLAISTSAL